MRVDIWTKFKKMTRVVYMQRQAGVACKSRKLKERGRRPKDRARNVKKSAIFSFML